MRNSLKLYLISQCVIACTHAPYRVRAKDDDLYVVEADSNRFAVQCEPLENGRTGMMIHVLDEQNTYWTGILPMMVAQADCLAHQRGIEAVLSGGRQMTFVGIGDLEAPREHSEGTYLFPKLGRFPPNGRVLSWEYIANERGQCYGAYTLDHKPCAREGLRMPK